MPFRTRDFALFLLSVAFLVVGITSTAKSNLVVEQQQATVISFDNANEEVSYKATLPEQEEDFRSSRLAQLREKISKLVISKPSEIEPEIIEETTTDAEGSQQVAVGYINLCPNYTAINPPWSPKGLNFEIVEGARLVYREISPVLSVSDVGSTTVPASSREIVLQLPLRTFPMSAKTCLASDVIGIALDGSLIRNNEQGLYKVFGSETLIGYALDGFPVYGLDTTIQTDECGGSLSAGEYSYYLSPLREGVLGCFGGDPVSI